MGERKDPTPEVVRQVLVASRRRCCICFGLHKDLRVKTGQLAHLNRDRSDSDAANLAFMCLEHHDWFDSKTSQSKGPTVGEARHYRDELYEEFRRRDEAEAGEAVPATQGKFQPIFVDDEVLNIRWTIRAPPEQWLDVDLRVVDPYSLQDLLDGPIHADPSCSERLAESGRPPVLLPQCPRCAAQLFVIPFDLDVENRYLPLWRRATRRGR